MAGGRPRTVCPDPEEMHKLGEEMLAFVSDKKNRVLHLSEWWSTEMFFTEKVWDTMCRRPEFVPYYDKALRIIGKQYLDKTSNVRDGISQRWQRVYFKDLKREEDQDCIDKIEREKILIEFTEKLKAAGGAVDSNTIEQFNQVMTQLASLSPSARKIAESNNKDEAKS